MKKLVLSLFVLLLTPLSSLSFSSTLQDLNTSQVTQTTDYNTILQKWFKENKILGKRIITPEDAKNLILFPDYFKSFKIRIIKHNSAVTMDFSSKRINFFLDENGNLEKVSIG